jgi:hypothetical protein
MERIEAAIGRKVMATTKQNLRIISKSGRFIALIPDTLTGNYSVVATECAVGSFVARWPCNGIPQHKSGGYYPIRFEFSSGGDLIDLSPDPEAIAPNCGSAMLALSQDAQEFAESAIARRRNIPEVQSC